MNRLRETAALPTAVPVEHHVRGQHPNEALRVSIATRCKESPGKLVPPSTRGLETGPARFDVSPRANRDLAAVLLALVDPIESRLPQRSIMAIDLLVVLWTAAWLVLGIAVGTFVERLGAVGDGLENTGRAIGRAGDAIDQLSDVPLVGGGFAAIAQEIQGLGRETVQNGRSVEDDVDSLALLIGAGLALGPTLPILALWVPPRVSRERERHALRKSLKSDDRVALAYLVNRAVATRLFRELRKASDDPVADLAAGRYEALAALEMDHLSLGSFRTKH